MNTITVGDLMERLAEFDPEAEIRLATQPNWPLAYQIEGVATGEEIALDTECEDHGHFNCEECTTDIADVVWIVEGNHPDDSPYAPKAAWEVAR